MLEQYEKMRSAPARESEEGESTALASTMLAPLTHGVAPPLEGLRPITLAEAATRVNSIWAGRALFVRTVQPALRLVGVSLVVEDSQGAVLTVSLYNLVAPEEDPQTVFPVGTCLALSEPCAAPASLPARPAAGAQALPHGRRVSAGLHVTHPRPRLMAGRQVHAPRPRRPDAAAHPPPLRQPASSDCLRLRNRLGSSSSRLGRGRGGPMVPRSHPWCWGLPSGAEATFETLFAAGRLEEASALAASYGSAASAAAPASLLCRVAEAHLAAQRWRDALHSADACLAALASEQPPRSPPLEAGGVETSARLARAEALLCLQRLAEAAAALGPEASSGAAEGGSRRQSAAPPWLARKHSLRRDAARAEAERRGVFDFEALRLEAVMTGPRGLSRRRAPV